MVENLHICHDDSSLKSLLKSANSQVVVIHFEAEWAAECKQMNDVFFQLAEDFQHALFIRIEAEELPEITQQYEVESVPTFILLKNSKVIDKIEGADAASLTKKVKHHVTSFVSPIVAPEVSAASNKNNLEDRLKNLINQSFCMLFMKGEPDAPQCGFSREIVTILRNNGIQFAFFDILTDDTVREGLKKFSNWPTYPQLYINGELVGGLDIVRELAETGELLPLLSQNEDLNTRLSKLVKKAPIMVFMKGSPENPRCKFSKELMEVLRPFKFESFDILENEEVRQGLKTFSDWPTFPQIYVGGEFIGGLDIIKGLRDSGELESTLCPPS
ncbi:glutaredoxin-3 isoform X2 [Hydra vulgaris]|uniref:Glutaredoxin-3 isoform X2 n=1 Tax=Hydra vulgaris TaxID=6087 RepID=A0ABM4BKA6_HYDVU